MKTFVLKGPLAGLTGMVASWWFEEGQLQLPDEEADGAARILCRFYACEIVETDEMIVAIWGPKADNEWRERAQQVARGRWPGYALVVRHPDEFKPLDPEEVAKLAGVLVTDGCDLVVQGCKRAGVKDRLVVTIPLDPTVPDPNRTGSENQQLTRTGTYLADPNEEERQEEEEPETPPPEDLGVPTEATEDPAAAAAAPTGDADPEVVARFVAKEPHEIRELLLDEEMLDVFSPTFVKGALALEQQSDNPRQDVMAMLATRAGVTLLTTEAPAAPRAGMATTTTEGATVEGSNARPSMTPTEFSQQGIRAIRRLLRDSPDGLFTAAFLTEALALEEAKAKPRGDVLRKLSARLAAAR